MPFRPPRDDRGKTMSAASQLPMPSEAPASRIPLPVKLVFTAFMAVLLPVYLTQYGPTNFLYFCDQALLLTLVGIWIESPLLISLCAVGILAPQLLWIVDFLGTAIGLPITGMTAYMFDPTKSLLLRALSGDRAPMPGSRRSTSTTSMVSAMRSHRAGCHRWPGLPVWSSCCRPCCSGRRISCCAATRPRQRRSCPNTPPDRPHSATPAPPRLERDDRPRSIARRRVRADKALVPHAARGHDPHSLRCDNREQRYSGTLKHCYEMRFRRDGLKCPIRSRARARSVTGPSSSTIRVDKPVSQVRGLHVEARLTGVRA